RSEQLVEGHLRFARRCPERRHVTNHSSKNQCSDWAAILPAAESTYSSSPASSFGRAARSSRSVSSCARQSSSTSYSLLTGRSLIGPFGPRSESLRIGLRLFFGGASGPKLRLRTPGAPVDSAGRGVK